MEDAGKAAAEESIGGGSRRGKGERGTALPCWSPPCADVFHLPKEFVVSLSAARKHKRLCRTVRSQGLTLPFLFKIVLRKGVCSTLS